jgi:hypothetical protein
MKNAIKTGIFALTIGMSLAAGMPAAVAHERSGISWSISIGSPLPPPVVHVAPPVVYVPAQPVYVQPYPVYVVPQPVYVQPAPVIRFGRIHHDGHRHPYLGGHERRHFHSHR